MAEDATAEDAMAEDATAEDATAEDAMAEDATVKNTTAELSKKGVDLTTAVEIRRVPCVIMPLNC